MQIGWITFAALVCAACESGTEVAGVGQATSVRTSDGSVVVTATLACMLAKGMARADGHCDADNTRVCVEARWFRRTEAPPTSQSPGTLTSSQICRKVRDVRGEKLQITMPPGSVPTDAAAIVVFSADQHMAKRAPHEVVIANP
jgi:hypothetical protein